MGALRTPLSKVDFTVSGDGSSEAEVVLVAADLPAHRVKGLVAYQTVGSLTAIELYVVTNGQAPGTAVTSIPQGNIAVQTSNSSPGSASSVTAFERTAITGHAQVGENLILRVKPTGAGAWTIAGYLQLER